MKILGSSRILVPVVTLLTTAGGCIPIPAETTRPRTIISTLAGSFAGPASEPPCTLELLVEPDPRSEPGRFDAAGNLVDLDGDHLETIVLRAIVGTEDFRVEWSLDGVPAGQEETIAVDLTLGDHVIDLDAECDVVRVDGTAVTIRWQARERITLVGPTTPTAVFDLDDGSFIGGDLVDRNSISFVAVRPDGIVHVILDGTPSSGGLESTIVRYVWSVDGAVIAFGPAAIAPLAIGEHSIQLFVENSAGESHILEFRGIKIVEPE